MGLGLLLELLGAEIELGLGRRLADVELATGELRFLLTLLRAEVEFLAGQSELARELRLLQGKNWLRRWVTWPSGAGDGASLTCPRVRNAPSRVTARLEAKGRSAAGG